MGRIGEHSFSIEMRSKRYLNQISMSDRGRDPVLIEGFLGDIENVSLVEDVMFEINGVNGVLRVDITNDELMKLLSRKASNKSGDSEGGKC